MTAMPSPLASSIKRRADSRTWPTDPAGPSSSSTVTDWIESTTRTPGRPSRVRAVMRPTSFSATTRIRSPTVPSSSPSRPARSRTCPADSSPLAYRTSPAVAVSPAAAWSSRVDLPIPGSPPSSTTDPGTSPPPRTRSSSEMPVGVRTGSASRRPARDCGTWPAPGPVPAPAARPLWSGSRTSVSTRVFQAPQVRHWPSQRRWAAPHAWQMYRLCWRANPLDLV